MILNLDLSTCSMAVNFKNNYVLADSASNSAWQLLCTWDFSVTNEKAVKQRRNNLCVQLKVTYSFFFLKNIKCWINCDRLKFCILHLHTHQYFIVCPLAAHSGVFIRNGPAGAPYSLWKTEALWDSFWLLASLHKLGFWLCSQYLLSLRVWDWGT